MGMLLDEKAPIQDHCGIVAAFASGNITFFERGLAGLTLLQTRGYDGAGFSAQSTYGQIVHRKGIGMVREVFPPSIVEHFRLLKARSWIFQVRYGTSGGFVPENVQPIITTHRKDREPFVVIHNGQFATPVDQKETADSDTLTFANNLAATTQSTWEQRIVSEVSRMRGAWSLVVSTKHALYIARDPWGFRPFVYGHVWDSSIKGFVWVAASETSALAAMGVTDFFELLPGSIAKVSDTGLQILLKHHEKKSALCIFENIYLQHGAGQAHVPRSSIRAVKRSPTVDDVRRCSGKILAREAPLDRHAVDMVIGVPGTGIEGGMAFARTLDIPYFQAITDRAVNLVEQRTFMTANIDSIYEKVLEHFKFDAQALRGRRVALVDDSIVRGNITKGLVYLLKKSHGVVAVHLRIVSPAIDKACHLGVNTRAASELIAARLGEDVEKIRAELNADSLAYLSASGLKEALTGDPKSTGFCMGCMVGHAPPIDEFGAQIKHQQILPGKEPAVALYEDVPISYPSVG
ncbi:hypothetical protein A3A63_03200 [Candidatus Gottesmanbacteria bacterium RIFCSPLOWO2_01_FULL_46_9]|uniref:Glutamine amidotransferase type-2 domain-containing protein n=1 Tax=Candidatus Gottesmanbacteria bacterium RIFCSPLOWO2_01_FULL_46_9 TaxID=1798394 RepID=A0A1F6B3L7_9BACT|nr:MAG: hypothetical protein A3A63_03200 [Candidatus Gottesmanbacteria bacterium RIFCSPLOWO2_01_FULL_46_9]